MRSIQHIALSSPHQPLENSRSFLADMAISNSKRFVLPKISLPISQAAVWAGETCGRACLCLRLLTAGYSTCCSGRTSIPSTVLVHGLWEEESRKLGSGALKIFGDPIHLAVEFCPTTWQADGRLGMLSTVGLVPEYQDLIDVPAKVYLRFLPAIQ